MYIFLIFGLLVILCLVVFPQPLKENNKIYHFVYKLILFLAVPQIFFILISLFWFWAGDGNVNLFCIPIFFVLFFSLTFSLSKNFLSVHYLKVLGFNESQFEMLVAAFFSLYVAFILSLVSLHLVYYLLHKEMVIN